MWLMTTQGFYSVVADRDSRDGVLIRARTQEDIEALRRQIPDLEPFEGAGTDYRWRAYASKAEWVAAAALLASAIDYPNFKNAVAERQGKGRASLYAKVWSTLLRLQER